MRAARALGFLRFFLEAQRGIWAVFLPLILIASTINWITRESLDRPIEIGLAVLALITAHLVFQKTSRETIEYARVLPLRRETALSLPYLASGLSLLLFALILHGYELSGLAYWPATVWGRLVGNAGPWEPRRRPLELLPGVFGWPLFAYALGLAAFEELRLRIDPRWVAGLARTYLLALVLGGLTVWLGFRLDGLLGAGWSERSGEVTGLALLLVAVLLFLRVRRLVVDGPIESWPTKEQAWES